MSDNLSIKTTDSLTSTASLATEDKSGVHTLKVGGTTPQLLATYTRAADATGAYAAGDHIGNTTTGASVVPILFPLGGVSGRLSGMRCTVTPASGSLVIAAFDFDLIVFRPATSIPFAAGSYPADNAALAVSGAAYAQVLGIFRFVNTGWRSPAGSVTVAGVCGYQASPLYSPVSKPRAYAAFNVSGLAYQGLYALMQAQNTWTPGNVAQQFDFAPDVDLD